MNVEQTIRDYISNVIHLSLATCADNKPWVCEVHFVYDKDLNLYFRSKPSRRHSKEISVNPYVAGNIISEHQLDEKVRGVYFEGTCKLIEGVETGDDTFNLFADRLGKDDYIAEEAKEEDGHKFYKISVDTYYLFDARDSKPSKKYELPWGKNKI